MGKKLRRNYESFSGFSTCTVGMNDGEIDNG